MARSILIEEFHVSLYAPRKLGVAEENAIQQTLGDVHFRSRLWRVVQKLLRQYPPLSKVRVRVSQ